MAPVDEARQTAGVHSPAVKGVVAMVAATALLTTNDAVAKYLTQSHPVGQVLCLRHLASLVLILIVVAIQGSWGQLAVRRWSGQLARGALFVATTGLIVASLSLLPLGYVTAVIFMGPIFLTAMSGPLLGETVGLRRWLAVLTGFLGVLVVVRPGGADFTWIALLPAAAAFTSALRDIATARLARTETSMSILLWSNVLLIVTSLGTAWWGWTPVSLASAAWLTFNGALNAAAHFLMIQALRIADASLVGPFKYTGLIWAFLLGWAVWGHVPDAATTLGAVVIAASGLAVMNRHRGPGR